MYKYVLSFVLFSSGLYGQKTVIESPPRVVLKTNVLPALNLFKQAVDCSADIRIKKSWVVFSGVGTYTGFGIFAPYKGEKYEGLRIKGGLKYIKGLSNRTANSYALMYKHNTAAHQYYVEMIRQGFQYRETALISRSIKTNGAQFLAGYHIFLGKNNRFVLEFTVGLGVAHHRVSRVLPYPDAEISEISQPSYIWEPGSRFWFDYTMGLHVGVAIW